VTKLGTSLGNQVKAALVFTLVLPLVLVVGVPALLVGWPCYWAYGRWLRLRWEKTWAREGKRILLVYSRSPSWQDYIETNWLPRLTPHAVILDWSDRSQWPKRHPLEIRVFRYWGGDEEFNPLVVIFPIRGKVRTIRFWRPFRDFKHGNIGALRKAEAELFELVDELQAA